MGKAKWLAVFAAGFVVALVAAYMLTSITAKQMEARQSYVKVTEVGDKEPDPKVWGQNFRGEYDSYLKQARTKELVSYLTAGKYGGSDAYPKLEKDPALKRLFAGNAFAVEYNEDRGHTFALDDITTTKRLGDTKPGACFTCKSSNVPKMMEQIGPEKFYSTPMKSLLAQFNPEHAISCADCHDAKTMALTITRPAFKEAMAERGIDVGKATREEMRSYVCAQCHVEYYFKGTAKNVTFPWKKGLTVDNIAAYYDEIQFKDWDHAETKAPLIKMQHPEFEMWSTGVHGRSGVSCTDCHMSYVRDGGGKITDHWLRSPLTNISGACGTCHRQSESQLRSQVLDTQDRTFNLMMRAEKALLDAQDAIKAAMDKGVADGGLKVARDLHRQSNMRWDFVAAENSMGFHSPQEAVRVLGDAIDFARQAELAAKAAMGKTQ